MANSILNGKIHEFIDWHDTSGSIINASDGGMIYVDGVYHWYGQALRPLPSNPNGLGGQSTTVGVVMYASRDLYNWEYEGVILPVSEDPDSPLRCPMRFERPKILFNKKTGEYVLWCHYVGYPGDHGQTPGTAEAGIAVCDKVNGQYRWLGTCRPVDGELVRDCTAYADRDGKGYFIYDLEKTAENRCQYIVELTDDYRAPTDRYLRIEPAYRREAAAVVRHDGYYFMITSALTSWRFNQAKYFRSRSLFGPWEDMGDPCVGDEDHLTFHSQSTYIFHVEGTDTDILMLERHNVENFLHCSYIWLPIEYHDDHTLSVSYREEWKI